jgi:hypothetical protein
VNVQECKILINVATTTKHPCVIELQAVFVNSVREHGALVSAGFIQMPFYEGGDLLRWLVTDERISDQQRLVVLRSALQGLAHLHAHDVLHCDIKPANVFVRRDGTAVIGDFDVSRDGKTRATMASTATNAAGVVGQTFDYMPPELVSSVATRASDVFSFGLVMFDLHYRPMKEADSSALKFQRPMLRELLQVRYKSIAVPAYANDVVAAPLRQLLEALLSIEPSTRPTALDALASRYFQLHLAGDRDVKVDRRECVVSLEECWLDEGVECGGERRHFICNNMLEKYVASLSKSSSPGKHSGHVKCPAKVLFAIFLMPSFMRMQKNAWELELERGFDLREKNAVERAVREKDVEAHRKHIVDKLLTLGCPRCGQAFVDFTGCLALTCGRCRAAFCAWCLVDCGSDAHRHVASCHHSLANGQVFASADLFTQCQRRRCERLVRDYLAALPASIDKKALVLACRRDFEDLAIVI